MKSIRRVQNICIGYGNLDRSLLVCENNTLLLITKLFNKFGRNLRNVELNGVYISMSGLRKLLQLCPNLESLSMQSVIVSDGLPSNLRFTLGTKSLRRVSMLYCNEKSQKIALEFVPETIQTFEICADDFKFLQDFFAQQKKIKSLTMKYYGKKIIVPETIGKMNLQELSLVIKGYAGDDFFMTSIIKSQLNLKVLDLSSSRISDETFLILCNMKKLETLKLVVNEVRVDIFDKIISLVNLKELTVIKNDERENMTHLISLTCWNYLKNKLRKLEILYPSMTITETTFHQLAKAMPDLEHLTINSVLSGSIIFSVINSFKFLKSLKLQDAHPFCMSELEFYLAKSCFHVNRNMQELNLKVNLVKNWRFIDLMIKFFPNLRKLEFETSIKGTDFDTMFGYILHEFNLCELIIFNSELWEIKNGEAAHMLRCNGQHMKLVQLNAVTDTLDYISLFGRGFVKVTMNLHCLQLRN